MFTETVNPRFSDTDALGHINNTMVPVWFEGARHPIFRIFTPELDIKNWPLILAKIDVSFLAQMYYGEPMEVRTGISRIGGASFDVHQEIWQRGVKCAQGTATMVHFCYKKQGSEKISDEIKSVLQQHLVEL